MGQVLCRDCRDDDHDADKPPSGAPNKNLLFVDVGVGVGANTPGPGPISPDRTADETDSEPSPPPPSEQEGTKRGHVMWADTPRSQIRDSFVPDDVMVPLPLPALKPHPTVASSPLQRPSPVSIRSKTVSPDFVGGRNPKSTDESRFIRDSLAAAAAKNNFVFGALSEHERQAVVDAMELVRYAPRQVIAHRGCVGRCFYLVSEGTVAVYAPKKGGARHGEGIVIADSADPLHTRASILDNAVGLEDDAIGASGVVDIDATSLTDESKCDNGDKDETNVRSQWRRSSFIASDVIESDDELVSEGSVTSNGRGTCHDLGRGASFGELALLCDCPRAATCIAKTPCAVWRIHRAAFRRCMAGGEAQQSKTQRFNEQQDAVNLLRKVDFLRSMDNARLSKIADVLTTATFKKDECIFRKGELGDEFYIVKEGLVKIHDVGRGDSQHCDMIFGPGYWFGEMALLKRGERRVMNATAVSDEVNVLVMSREEFETRLGPLQHLIDYSTRVKFLMSHPCFAGKVERHEIDALAKEVKTTFFSQGQVIASLGAQTTPALYFVESGKVRISDEGENTVNTLMKGDHFGADFFGANELKCSSPSGACISRVYIEAVEETKCAVFTRDSIEKVIGNISRLGTPLPHVSAKLDKSLKLEDMERHRIIGVGTHGKVWLVQHKKKRSSIYALKVMDKASILKKRAQKNVMWERNIMASIDHPFIVDLVTTYQDKHSLHMLMLSLHLMMPKSRSL